MIINFYSNGEILGRTLSEEDGYFSYFGLAPGEYEARIDTGQLRRLDMRSSPDSVNFRITSSNEGDFVDGLDFTIKTISAELPVPKKDTVYLIVHEVTMELVTISEDSYAIQLGAFREKSNAEALRRRLEKLVGRKIEIVIEDDFYKLRIIEIKERREVDEMLTLFHKEGFTELWVISMKAKRQQLVMVEKQDTTVTVIDLRTFDPEFFKLQLGKTPILEQTVLEEMKSLRPIGKLKFRDDLIIPVVSMEEDEMERPIIIVNKIETEIKIPSLRDPDILMLILAENKIIFTGIVPVPTIALQVAVFQKESQARQARKRIISKLKIQVEIVKQWDSYHVIATGFFTREETFPYYPELAGMGFTDIRLIEEFIRQE
jgi:hypothetical protein